MDGPVMSGAYQMTLTIEGKGGHSSLKNELNDPTLAACKLINSLEEFYQKYNEEEKKKLIPCFPML